ncbi:tripartite tricarboxylate transporter substrate binding protein [Ramlibacter sp. CGMCC 1.13660]|nr:tripartite tricarboxylate transporter substrate binding protein [Ramlibacter sp. CGMCC 1.13660]
MAFLGAGAAALLTAGPVMAQAYPDKAIRMVVPYAAGGGVDNIARVVAQHLAPRLKQPVVIDNKPGANANIGADLVAKAPPDGYTVLMGATFLAFNRAAMKNLPYDAAKDLVPVARVGRAPTVLVVPATLPVTNVAELVAYLKANADKVSYGAVGSASPPTLLFARQTGTAAVQVLYKGGSAALPDLMAGRLTYMIQTTSEVIPHIASGKLKALAVTSGERFKALPNVPTFKEAGVDGIDWTGWWGMFVPAGTPAAVVQRLSSEMQAVMAMPEVAAAVDKLGVEPAYQPAPEFGVFFRKSVSDHESYARDFKLSTE